MLACWAVSLLAADISSENTRISVSGDTYTIELKDPRWRFAGTLPEPPAGVAVRAGSDRGGDYQELEFEFRAPGLTRSSIRLYSGSDAILFSTTALEDTPNVFTFPEFSFRPGHLSHISFASLFAHHSFEGLNPQGPWFFFDADANTFVISPATQLHVSELEIAPSGSLRARIAPEIERLTEGYTRTVLFVPGKGINATIDRWGRMLTTLHGKTRPPSDADVTLAKFGYWTDAGASYYYKREAELGYEDTLANVLDTYRQAGLAPGYLQLDSWFYPKGPRAEWGDFDNGIYRYEADRNLFPNGLRAFRERVGVPLVTHSRWIDNESPYRRQYKMSANVVIDELYWSEVARYLAESGVEVFEQDWLGTRAQAELNLSDRPAFLGNMARAMRDRGLWIQYCMPLPRHFLQSAKYDNVSTIRVSADRFARDRWTDFLYSSRLASAVGLWPFTDVFMSSERDNLLLATLSAGPVGLGDRIGQSDFANLRQSVRSDGVIVKPDTVIVPVDSVVLSDRKSPDLPMIASAVTSFGDHRATYLFAYRRGEPNQITIAPSTLGYAGAVYVWDYYAGSGILLAPGETLSRLVDDTAYYVIVPVGASGIALTGDEGHFVSLGRKRIAEVEDGGELRARVLFAAGEETRVLHGYAPTAPDVECTEGSAELIGFDEETKRFRIAVRPSRETGSASLRLRLRWTDVSH